MPTGPRRTRVTRLRPTRWYGTFRSLVTGPDATHIDSRHELRIFGRVHDYLACGLGRSAPPHATGWSQLPGALSSAFQRHFGVTLLVRLGRSRLRHLISVGPRSGTSSVCGVDVCERPGPLDPSHDRLPGTTIQLTVVRPDQERRNASSNAGSGTGLSRVAYGPLPGASAQDRGDAGSTATRCRISMRARPTPQLAGKTRCVRCWGVGSVHLPRSLIPGTTHSPLGET